MKVHSPSRKLSHATTPSQGAVTKQELQELLFPATSYQSPHARALICVYADASHFEGVHQL